MTLLERIAANTECKVDGCHEPRVPDAAFCKVNGHLTDWFMGRLTKTETGYTALPARRFTARDETGMAA